MRNSHVALYLGCTALLAGGLGLSVKSAFDTGRPPEPPSPPLYMQAAAVPPPVESWPADPNTWPPDSADVAFHAEMIELLTPKTAVMAREEEEAEPPPPQRKRREVVREAPRETAREVPKPNAREATRETVREVPKESTSEAAKESKQKKATANRKKREQPAQAADTTEDVEVVVQDRFGNRIRTQRVEREAGAPRAERAGSSERVDREVRRAEREVERAPQERSFAPFPFFGLFSPQ